ncbi:MAG: hypothetical protein K9M45_10950 [Kiritimatiellales bacterium]|nr:hypothetical protein [Kiritimatiellales bacterium]
MEKKSKKKKSGKQGRTPALVPITPDLLRDEKWIPSGWPYADHTFNPSNDWKHLYRFHGSHGYCNDPSTPDGSLRIKRRAEGSSQRFLITQKFEHDSGRNHELKATLHCAVDSVATPQEWQLRSAFTDGEGQSIPGADSTTDGSFGNGKIILSTNGFKQFHASEGMASDWALIEAVQRLPFGMKEPLRFDLLEGLTLFRPRHEIYYQGIETFKSGGRSLGLHRFNQLGTGTLPYNYWLDENHRLILFVTHSRAYWLDSSEGKA